MSIETLVYQAIEEIHLSCGYEGLASPTPQTRLFDILDSLGTLDLILELENRLQHHYHRYIEVANEVSMDPEKTPFRDVGTLVSYLEELVRVDS